MSNSPQQLKFSELGLSRDLQKALDTLGYEIPTPIQAACIPKLLEGSDIIGQAQTGTGKTAAFALPLIESIDLQQKNPQVLVLTPTRELAIQVAEAFQTYARFMRGFHVLPIYGGQAYHTQLKALKRGVHVVVGTPGRVMDHINRKTLKLGDLKAMVLDEADEMLRMGFIEDVEWILGHTPEDRQVALFSATMPTVIKKIASKYLKNPQQISIKTKTQTVTTTKQSYWLVNAKQKFDALSRILESYDFDAVIIFVRTKNSTVDVAEKLDARGFLVAALNGDIPQNQRERTIERLKQGKIDIVVATDVAARGLDVPRISHVINYDVPSDNETYVHRIGRTGRAGRSGEAILFMTQRERRFLGGLERMTGQKIEPLVMPSTDDINQQRMQKFKDKIKYTLENKDLNICNQIVQSFYQETNTDPMLIAAALAKLVQGDAPLFLSDRPQRKPEREQDRTSKSRDRGEFSENSDRSHSDRSLSYKAKPLKSYPDIPMSRFRIEVGYNDDVKPGNIVGAIANEAEIDSCYIGSVDIFDDFSVVDLPNEMPPEILKILKKARIAGKPMGLSLLKPSRSEGSFKVKSFDNKRKKSNDNAKAALKRKSKKKHIKRKGKPVRDVN